MFGKLEKIPDNGIFPPGSMILPAKVNKPVPTSNRFRIIRKANLKLQINNFVHFLITLIKCDCVYDMNRRTIKNAKESVTLSQLPSS